MSIKSTPYYWVVCDGCGVSDGEFAVWADTEGALASANDVGWLTTLDGRHWCPECTTWSAAADEIIPIDAAFAAAERNTA